MGESELANGSPEDSDVTEEVPENDEDDDSHAAAAAGEFPCAVTGGNASQ